DNKSNPSVRFSADVNIRKNQNLNRLNAVNSGQFLENTFLSNIVYSKTWKFGTLSLNGMHSQNAITRQMDITLPALTFNVNRIYPFKRQNAVRQNVIDKIQIDYFLQARNNLTGQEDSIFMGDVLSRMQNGMMHRLPIKTNFNILRYITATPAIDLNSYMYTKTIRRDFIRNENGKFVVTERTAHKPALGYDDTVSTPFNTQVYSDVVFKGGWMKQVRHHLIPPLSYNYRPDLGQNDFGFYREVQVDTL